MLQCVEKENGVDGLGEMFIHAGCQGFLPVFLKGLGGHGDDGNGFGVRPGESPV